MSRAGAGAGAGAGAEEDEDYWNTSETSARAFSFDDDLLSTREILAIGKGGSTLSPSDDVFSGTAVKVPLLPLSSIVSPKVLELLLLAQSGKEPASIDNKRADAEESVSTTLRRLVLGRTCSLYVHRSLKSKTELLDGAVSIGDGNAILTVVLFLIQTLKRKLVYELLSSRPLALNHYISFLMSEGKTSELNDLLTMLGRSSEAAMYHYQHIVKSSGNNIDTLLSKLNNTLSNHFSQPGVDPQHTKNITNYIKFLEWQKCVSNSELNSRSVLQCLAYCCANHWHEGAGKMMSPLTLCQLQQISPLQYDWVALNVHATLKNWDVVESLFTKKDWLGRSTMSSNLPLPLMITKLHQLGAGNCLLASYINKIGNNEQRLEIAKQFKVHSVVIEAFAKQRDRNALTNYKMALNPQSEEYFLAENTLQDLTIKWKN